MDERLVELKEFLNYQNEIERDFVSNCSLRILDFIASHNEQFNVSQLPFDSPYMRQGTKKRCLCF